MDQFKKNSFTAAFSDTTTTTTTTTTTMVTMLIFDDGDDDVNDVADDDEYDVGKNESDDNCTYGSLQCVNVSVVRFCSKPRRCANCPSSCWPPRR